MRGFWLQCKKEIHDNKLCGVNHVVMTPDGLPIFTVARPRGDEEWLLLLPEGSAFLDYSDISAARAVNVLMGLCPDVTREWDPLYIR